MNKPAAQHIKKKRLSFRTNVTLPHKVRQLVLRANRLAQTQNENINWSSIAAEAMRAFAEQYIQQNGEDK